MFSLFNGEYGGKKNINLGGNRSAGSRQDRDALLKATQLERQQRDMERRRMNAAVQIQAFYQSRRAFRLECNAQRALFDAAWVSNASNPHQNPTVASKDEHTANQIMTRSSQLLFFWNLSRDVDRLNTLIAWLVSPSKNASQLPNVMVPFQQYSDQGKRWRFLLAKLVDRILETLSSQRNAPLDATLTVLAARLLQIIYFDKQSRILTLQSDVTIEDDSLHSASNTMLAQPIRPDLPSHAYLDELRFSIIQQGLFKQARLIILEKDANSIEIVSAMMIAAVDSFKETPMLYKYVLEEFAVHILTIPLVFQKIPDDASSQLKTAIPFEFITTILLNASTRNPDKSDTTLFESSKVQLNFETLSDSTALADNYLQLSEKLFVLDSPLSGISADTIMLYVVCARKLLSALDINLFRQFDAKERKSKADADAYEAVTVSENSPSYLMGQLTSFLSNTNRIINILKTCQSPSHFFASLSYLAIVLVLCSSTRSDILKSLQFHPELQLLARIWSMIHQNKVWIDICTPNSQLFLSTVPEHVDVLNSFAVFSELMSQELLALGDDELFNSSFPLSQPELIELCTSVKNMSIKLCWMQSSDNTGMLGCLMPLDYLRSLFTRLMRQLHDRDARKLFCPPNHWLMEDLTIGDEFVDLIFDSNVATPVTSIGPSQRFMRATACHSILSNIPFVIPFQLRVQILRKWIKTDRKRYVEDQYRPLSRITIRRSSVFEDGFDHLNSLGSGLKGRVSITFIDEHGLVEAGIDGGGVFKEFLTACLKQAFNSNYGLFETTKDQLLFPSSSLYATQDSQLQLMEFLGRIIGKALYDGVLLDSAFATFFLAKWLGKRSYLDDLPSLDTEFYNGLLFLKKYTGDVEKDLALNFTVSENEFGVPKIVELIPNGANISVTKENRIRYIYLVANYRLNTKIAKQCQAFFHGLSDLIHPSWLKLFDEQELQVLLGGSAVPIDLDDLRQNTVYSGVYDDKHPTIVMFWEVLQDFDEDQRRKLVKYVTSCSRPPILGFCELYPLFSIRDSSTDQARLPTASTCVNLLKLPRYESKDILRQKLIYAIDSDAGFELS
ncbi:ubiquitin-protein ligase (E3) [Batrachochytrium dendrobatidis]|nr:ubiquitin-protein ligase (E3) [Batrachochytrium dendrobatidis]